MLTHEDAMNRIYKAFDEIDPNLSTKETEKRKKELLCRGLRFFNVARKYQLREQEIIENFRNNIGNNPPIVTPK